MMRAIRASESAAIAQTPRKTISGTADRRDSSSSGSASVTGGPGSAECGWITYSHPVAARTTPNERSAALAILAALSMFQPPCCSEIRAPRHSTPQRPVVPAFQLEVGVRNASRAESSRKRSVLVPQRIVGAGVEPEVRVGVAQGPGLLIQLVEWGVRCDTLQSVSEDRVVVRGHLVARPALDEREFQRVVQRDVDGAVAAFREAADSAPRGRSNCPVARVDSPDDIT